MPEAEGDSCIPFYPGGREDNTADGVPPNSLATLPPEEDTSLIQDHGRYQNLRTKNC